LEVASLNHGVADSAKRARVEATLGFFVSDGDNRRGVEVQPLRWGVEARVGWLGRRRGGRSLARFLRPEFLAQVAGPSLLALGAHPF